MDIFIINKSSADNISWDLLKQYQHKNISNEAYLKEHCFAYLMVDRILKNEYKENICEIDFVNNKPYLKDRKKYFSISHTKNFVAICFSNYECGIDIEVIKPRDFQSIGHRMKFKCETLEEFYYEWTKYEAEYKLNAKSKSIKQFKYEDCIITAVSEKIGEVFEIYIQSGKTFSNL